MFYSHQLLSKKHPMGQIWIAATIRASINRKKAAKINIEQICKQILNPPVPLALRLSGILMGGIVHIYNRKVYFLYEDLNAFLMKIKVEAARKDVDRTTLPKRKNRARYENITMDSEGFQVSENIERPMRQPSVPLEEGENTLEEMFFVFPDAGNGGNFESNSSPPDRFQAAVEDITLLDNALYSPLSAGGQRKSGSSASADSILGPMDDFLPPFELPGQRSTLDNSPAENGMPDPIIPDNIPPDLSGALHTILEEQLPAPENNKRNAEAVSHRTERERRSARRNTGKRKARVLMYDEDSTELPKKMFAKWLEDSSDIVGRRFVIQVARINKQRVTAVQQNWALPSVCVSLRVKFRSEPTWAPPLQHMWISAISPRSRPDSGDSRARFDDTVKSPPSRASKRNSPKETDVPTGRAFPLDSGVPVGGGLPQETDFPVEADSPMEADLRMDPEDLPQSPPQSTGSVEKLRAALQTPSTGSQEDVFGNKLGLRTPALFAPINTGGSSKRSMSASHGGSLSYDSEGEPPTSGKSRRSRSDRKGVRRSMSPIPGDLPELNFLPRRASDKSDMISYFASGDFQAGILAQSQLLEDTSGSTQKPMPADSINTTTIVLAKLLREHFNKLKNADIFEASIFNLTSRLDKTQAARMFYQICVLASNQSVTVKQAEPYGDIILERGVTL